MTRVCVVLLTLAAACTGAIEGGGETSDGAPSQGADAFVPAPDGPPDTPDSPVPDAALPTADASVPVPDGSIPLPDAAPDSPVVLPDAATPDAATPDAPPPDAGAPEADAATLPPSCSDGVDPHGGVPALVFFKGYEGSGDETFVSTAAVADLDRDGANEIVAGRDTRLVAWNADGSIKWTVEPTGGRIWASPVIANFTGDADLEVVIASRAQISMLDAAGNDVSPFPEVWRDEVRAIAAGDLDDDGKLEIVAVTTDELEASGQADIIHAFRATGAAMTGYPPNTSGTSGCDTACYVHGGFDQTLAIGRIDGDADLDIFAPHDNAYMSWHHGNGVAFDAASIFKNRKKSPGIRWMLDYALAQQGFGASSDLQAHFTNSAPAISDIDGDGVNELVVLGSVQNVGQNMRELGTVLFVFHADGTRPAAWVVPFRSSTYLGGLHDLGANIVGITQEVAIADLSASVDGKDMVFPGFDGKIHLVGADRQQRWSYTYTTDSNVFASGPVIADLTQDGVPEVVFATYSTTANRSALYVLDALGNLQQKIDLPGRGAMPAPTIADIDGDGTLEIIVALKDPDGDGNELLAWTVPGSGTSCMPWPMNRKNLRRSGS